MEANPELKRDQVSPEIKNILYIMAATARTAPKTKGQDTLVTAILNRDEMNRVADEMDRIAEERGEKWRFFSRDADNIRNSHGCLLIGINSPEGLKLECGACGMHCADIENKIDRDFRGPICAFKSIDLGIALGSAVYVARQMGLDCRIQYTAGLAARRLGLIDADIVMAVPVSISGKNIFFDRKW